MNQVNVDSLLDIIIDDLSINKNYNNILNNINLGINQTEYNSSIQNKFLLNKGSYYIIKKKYNKAIESYNEVIKNIKKDSIINQEPNLCDAYINLAIVYLQLDSLELVQKYNSIAENLVVIKDFTTTRVIYDTWYKFYYRNENPKSKEYSIKSIINDSKEYLFNLFFSKDNLHLYGYFSNSFDRLAYELEFRNEYLSAKNYYTLGYNYMIKSNYYPDEFLNITEYNLAYVESFIKKDKSLEFKVKKVQETNRNLNTPDKEIEAGCLSILGDIRRERKDFVNAQKYYNKALEIAKVIYRGNNIDLQYFYEALALNSFESENYSDAAKYYKIALSLTVNKDGKNNLLHLIGLADSYSHTNPLEAQKIYYEALKIAEINPEMHKVSTKARIYYKLGLLEKNKNEAINFFELSGKEFEEYPYPLYEGCLNYIELARNHKENETEFIGFMDKAIKACLIKNHETDYELIPNNYDINFPILLIGCYSEIADYYTNKSQDKSLEYLHLARLLIEQTKPIYKYNGSKSELTKVALPIYKRIVSISSKKYKSTNDEKFFQDAFNASEKTRAIELTDELNDYEAIQQAGIPDSLFQYGQNIKLEIAALREELNSINDDLKIDLKHINNKIVELSLNYNNHLIDIEKKYPRYYNLKHNIKEININTIKKKIKKNEILLEYQIQDSVLYIFGIGKDKNVLLSKDISKSILEEKVDEFMYHVYKADSENIVFSSHELYNILLSDIQELFPYSNQYTIIPDGILNYMPFEVLHQKTKKNTELIRDKSIIYNYSANQINNQAIPNRNKNLSVLGIAPQYLNLNFPNLPYAKREINEIKKVWKNETLINEEANVKNFIEKSEDHTIVHIAGHTELNHEFPLQSRLVFSEIDSSTASDYSLHAYELYNMKLDLDMVTLSSCNSGIGKFKVGEGNMSLARGFAYAGCPSTVTTLWPMADRPTMDIMVRYYKNLKKGMSKSNALRKAKLSYIDETGPKGQAHYFWGGIVIIGSDSPVYLVPFWQRPWFLILLGLSLLLFLHMQLKRFKSIES